jgi:hypothetical protein
MATPDRVAQQPARGLMPGGLRWAAFAAVGLVLAGALYLLSVRGEALLLDLETLGRAFCF